MLTKAGIQSEAGLFQMFGWRWEVEAKMSVCHWECNYGWQIFIRAQRVSIFSVWKDNICAITQSGWIPLFLEEPCMNHLIKLHAHAEGDCFLKALSLLPNIFLPLPVKIHFLSRLLHKPKCSLAFDSLADALAFSTGDLGKKKGLAGISSSSDTAGISSVNSLWTKHGAVNADCRFSGFRGWGNFTQVKTRQKCKCIFESSTGGPASCQTSFTS